MGNTLTNFNNALLAFDIDSIQAEVNNIIAPVGVSLITPFDAFASRFENIPSGTGTINVPIPTYATASQTNTGNGIVISNAQVSTAQLSLTNDWYQFYAFNPTDYQAAPLSDLVKTFIAPAIYAVEASMLSASFAVVANTSNFVTSSAKPSGSSASNWTTNVAIQLNSDLSNKGIFGDRILVLNSTAYWNGLINDLTNKNNAAGAAAIQSGTPNNPLNMRVSEAGTLLPTANNLLGFAGTKGGVILGTAIPNVVHPGGEAIVIQSPRSKAYMLVEQYFSENLRQWVIGASVLGNAIKGNGCLVQLVSQ